METELVKKYAVLAADIKKYESAHMQMIEEYKEQNDFESIRDQVLEEMLAEKQKTIPTEYGNVTVRETKTYEYPDSWEQETKEYKLRKKKIEKDLLTTGRYSVNTSLQLAGKPKTIESKDPNPVGTIH